MQFAALQDEVKVDTSRILRLLFFFALEVPVITLFIVSAHHSTLRRKYVRLANTDKVFGGKHGRGKNNFSLFAT